MLIQGLLQFVCFKKSMWFFFAFCKPHHFGILNELLKELFIITLLYGYTLTKNVHELDGASKQKKPQMVFDFKE